MTRATAVIALVCGAVSAVASPENFSSLSLAGEWEVQLGPAVENRPNPSPTPDRIVLPGTVAGNGYGQRVQGPSHSPAHDTWGRLSPIDDFAGIARYAREVNIPDSWDGKLLACTLPLADRYDDDAAAQLFKSLLAYAASPQFAPRRTISIEKLCDLLK